jgi:hypothetical protein
MAKIKELTYQGDDGTIWHHQFLYWCEGCGYEHTFALSNESFGGHHQFNGNLDDPTVSPSLLQNGDKVCHSFLTNGQMQYLSDCHHHLANQTVELKDFEEMIELRKTSSTING